MQPPYDRPDHSPHDDRAFASPSRHADGAKAAVLDHPLQLLDEHEMIVAPPEAECCWEYRLEKRAEICLACRSQRRVGDWRDVADISS
jgi:hypothetical protein